MHGHVPKGPHEYHLVAAVFDAATGARVSDAAVTAEVSGLGLSGSKRKLEPMQIAGKLFRDVRRLWAQVLAMLEAALDFSRTEFQRAATRPHVKSIEQGFAGVVLHPSDRISDETRVVQRLAQ
jgi:hypothetical protein